MRIRAEPKFCRCSSITQASVADGAKAGRSAAGMFVYCTSFSSPDPLPLDTSKATGMSGTLDRCSSLTSLESSDSSGAVSLGNLFSGEPMPVALSDKQLDDIAFLTCRGGWPQSIGMTERQALRQARDYHR